MPILSTKNAAKAIAIMRKTLEIDPAAAVHIRIPVGEGEYIHVDMLAPRCVIQISFGVATGHPTGRGFEEYESISDMEQACGVPAPAAAPALALPLDIGRRYKFRTHEGYVIAEIIAVSDVVSNHQITARVPETGALYGFSMCNVILE